MINLHYHNKYILVYNPDDWNILRTQHRIVGELLGDNGKNEDLPATLTIEEAVMLIEKKICKLITCNYICSDENKKLFDEQIDKLYEDEKDILREERKTEVEGVIDKIIAGKRKKGITNISPEAIMKEEMAKLQELKKENVITVINTQHPECMKDSPKEIATKEIFSQTTKTKCAVYKDLWEKGYYITTARKFGGDFLVYLGDPVAYHALYIVKCIEDGNSEMNASEIVMYGRLGNSVKKNFVLANLKSKQTVKYITINWMET